MKAKTAGSCLRCAAAFTRANKIRHADVCRSCQKALRRGRAHGYTKAAIDLARFEAFVPRLP
jgi:hypothetical protein